MGKSVEEVGKKRKQKSRQSNVGLEYALGGIPILIMRNFKSIALCGLLAAMAGSYFGPAQAQTSTVADIKATAEAIQTLQDQQKTITDNQAKIDAKLATIAENVRVARLYQSRAR